MTKEELITKLTELNVAQFQVDWEKRHINADELLLAYINDPAVTEAFEAIDKWYA